jgi:hypothetical protein
VEWSVLFKELRSSFSRLREFIILERGEAPNQTNMPQAYCVKCKANIEIKNPQAVTLKNGKPAVKGVCPNRGTSVFRIGKA